MEYTELQARDALVLAISQMFSDPEFSGIYWFGENSNRPNMDEVDFVTEYDIEYKDRYQVTLDNNPIVRTEGILTFTIGVRQGDGTRKLYATRYAIDEAMRAKYFDKVRTLIPRPDGGFDSGGWTFEVLRVPFRFDSKAICQP